MIGLLPTTTIFLATAPTDLRKAYDGLAVLVRQSMGVISRQPVRAHQRMRQPPGAAFELAKRLGHPSRQHQIIDRSLITVNRVNLSYWARVSGLGGQDENDYWLRVRNQPVIAMAGAVALAVNDGAKYGLRAAAQVYAQAVGDLASDFLSVGAALKVPDKILADTLRADGDRPARPLLDPYAERVPVSFYVTEQLLDSFIPGTRQADELLLWVDPQKRRRTVSKTIGYEPGIIEAIRVGHWTGLLDRLAGQEPLPPAGPIDRKTGAITPAPTTDTERMLSIMGFNVKPVPRSTYEAELMGR
jgi:hypothetical protein